MTRPASGTQITTNDREIPAFSARTVRMPGSGAGTARDPDSLLPRGFPTLDELAECETAEEKEELCEKADLLVERLEAKADSAEAFVDGPICGFFGFLKPNAIRNAEKARAAAEEAAAAAELRRKAKGGAGNAAVAAGAAILVLAGAAAVVLGGGVDGVVTPSGGAAPGAAKSVKSVKSAAAKPAVNFAAKIAPEPKSSGPYGVEAADLVSSVKDGQGDALAAYEALQRK